MIQIFVAMKHLLFQMKNSLLKTDYTIRWGIGSQKRKWISKLNIHVTTLFVYLLKSTNGINNSQIGDNAFAYSNPIVL